MAMFVGIDGIRGGWVAVYLDKGRQRSDHACRLESLLVSPTHGAFYVQQFSFFY
jgi:predicted RNase H-like nuclease